MRKVNEAQLTYLSFLNRENNYRHHYYNEEMKQYELLKEGNFAAVEESVKMFSSPLVGHLSDDSVRNLKYLFVASITLATRFAIEGGMDSETAYNSSDLYINRMDSCVTEAEIQALNKDMFLFFTERMAAIRKGDAASKAISLCLDYIDFHLYETISAAALADYVGLNRSYLSTRFKQEMGMTISDYIRKRRITTAENMLKFSDFSYVEIATYLSFSTQSYFIRVFKEETGYTPKEYRQHFFRSSFQRKSHH